MGTRNACIFWLASLALVAGCVLPNGSGAQDELTVGSLLPSSGGARLVGLKAGSGEVEVPLPAGRSSFLAFHSLRQTSARLAVSISEANSSLAYRTQAVPAPAVGTGTSGGPALAEAHPPASAPEGGAVPFEQRLRAWQAPLAGLPPEAARYRLAEAPAVAVGDSAQFWVIADLSGGQPKETQVTAEAAYVGEHCYVYVDASVPQGSLDERVAEIGRTFDQQIYPTDTRLFGVPEASGVNGDARITLLITPAVGNFGQDTTIGYFTVRDLFKPERASDQALLRHSNRRLMLYISSTVVAKGKPADYLGTIAHEFQHLINATAHVFRKGGAARTEDVWLDEGLAMYAMEANGYGLAGGGGVVFNHVAAYQRRAASYSLTDWKLNPEESAYGAAYLFTTYLVDRFGEEILADLVRADQFGVSNVDARAKARGSDFDQVFADWAAANLLDHSGYTEDARFGYRSLNMLGDYGGRRLRGLSLEPVRVPNAGALDLRPYSAQYFYVPSGAGGTYRFQLRGNGSQDFGGLVVAP